MLSCVVDQINNRGITMNELTVQEQTTVMKGLNNLLVVLNALDLLGAILPAFDKRRGDELAEAMDILKANDIYGPGA